MNPLNKITLILPTYNNGGTLQKHLSDISPIYSQFGRIIAVDSYSNDGSYQTLQNTLPEHALIYQRERGLYASWNDAIDKVETEYTYISTIGDTPLLKDYLEFCEHVIKSSIDFAISPPKNLYEQVPRKGGFCWPIDRILSALSINETITLTPECTRLVNAYSTCLTAHISPFQSLSGSFASNLCKTKVLQNTPFPEDCGRAGDTAWMSSASMNTPLTIFSKPVANFLFHESKHKSIAQETNEHLHTVLGGNFDESIKKLDLKYQSIRDMDLTRRQIRNIKKENRILKYVDRDYHALKKVAKVHRKNLLRMEEIIFSQISDLII